MAELTINPGDIPTAAQWNSYMLHTGAGFNTWTPVVTQSVAVSLTVQEASYFRAGRFIFATCIVAATSTGTAANDVTITLPVTAKSAYTTSSILGTGHLFDASGPTHYSGEATFATTTTVKLRKSADTTGGFLGSTGFTAALASSDVVVMQVMYEAASG